MKMVPDRSGRFRERPFYKPEELDAECEELVSEFLSRHRGRVEWPIRTDDIVTLLEEHAESVDLYADLSTLGAEVEGVTDFYPGRRPVVRIAAGLSSTSSENRLRTTLTHELGHVRLHGYLFETADLHGELFDRKRDKSPPRASAQGATPNPTGASHQCRRETMLDAKEVDWMEWQAGYACGALLMPRTPLRALVREFGATASSLAGVTENTPEAEQLIAAVVARFAVSKDAARIRLLKIGAIGGPSRGQLSL